MRTKLSQHKNEYILGKGWISNWEQLDKTKFRMTVSNPILKKANKNVLFENQAVISKEHHINFFIDLASEEYEGDEFPYQMYDCICFAGRINEYTRKDGTKDFGVYTVPQSMLEYNLCEMNRLITFVRNQHSEASTQMLYCLEKQIVQRVAQLEIELETAGNLLPTFKKTYAEYRTLIDMWKFYLVKIIKRIRCIHSNRAMRRQYGVKSPTGKTRPKYKFAVG